MKKWICVIFVVCASPLAAQGIDSNQVMLCAPHGYSECTSEGCLPVDSVLISAPRFIKIDIKKKRLEPVQGGLGNVSKIDHIERVDGKIMVQGVEDGVEGIRDGIGYTIAIVEDSGDMVFSAVSDGVSFVAFGACTNLP